MMKKIIDGKKIIIKGGLKNIPSTAIIKNIYSKIPDDKKIPVVFETKTQYLNEYIKNQEKARGKPFPKKDIAKYKDTELANMSNIVSRYTTKHNPYIDVRTVFFTDNKITPSQFTKSAFHEYGHEAWESKPSIRKDWKGMNKDTAPTRYGTTSKQEDFAESYMLYKTGQLRDPKRSIIIADNISHARKMPEFTIVNKFLNKGFDMRQFDMNNDGKINDIDIDIMRRKGLLKELSKSIPRDTTSKDSVADALGWAVPEGMIASASWKLYGAPKKYDPRVQERGNLKQNIFNITKGHYTTLGRNPFMYGGLGNALSQGLSTDATSQDLNLVDVAKGIGKGVAFAGQRLSPTNIERTYKGEDRPNIQTYTSPRTGRKRRLPGHLSDQKYRLLPAAGAGLKWTTGKALNAGQAIVRAGISPEYYGQLVGRKGILDQKQAQIGTALRSSYKGAQKQLQQQEYAAGARRDIAGAAGGIMVPEQVTSNTAKLGLLSAPKWLTKNITHPLTYKEGGTTQQEQIQQQALAKAQAIELAQMNEAALYNNPYYGETPYMDYMSEPGLTNPMSMFKTDYFKPVQRIEGGVYETKTNILR